MLKRMEDKVRDLIQNMDYLLYLLLNPFKFKPMPQHIKKILVVELLNYGDLMVITPVLKALKHAYKEAKIDVVIKPGKEEILKRNPNVHACIPYTTFSETKSKLQKESYDLGIMLHPGSFKISLLLLLSNIKYRVGCAKTGITYGKGFFLNKKIFPNNQWQHKIEDNLDVIRAIGITPKDKHLELFPSAAAERKIKTLLKKYKHPWVGISAASAHWTQQWYPEKYAEVITYYTQQNATMFFTGTKEEEQQVGRIISLLPNKENIVDLTGRTTCDELMALIRHLDLLITIDSSATHIASAFDTPVLTLFGPTIPTFWGPTGKNPSYIWKEKEACVGCRRYFCIYKKDHECMKSITPEEVIAKSQALLKK